MDPAVNSKLILWQGDLCSLEVCKTLYVNHFGDVVGRGISFLVYFFTISPTTVGATVSTCLTLKIGKDDLI